MRAGVLWKIAVNLRCGHDLLTYKPTATNNENNGNTFGVLQRDLHHAQDGARESCTSAMRRWSFCRKRPKYRRHPPRRHVRNPSAWHGTLPCPLRPLSPRRWRFLRHTSNSSPDSPSRKSLPRLWTPPSRHALRTPNRSSPQHRTALPYHRVYSSAKIQNIRAG